MNIINLPEEILEEIFYYAAYDVGNSNHSTSCCQQQSAKVRLDQYKGIIHTCTKFRRIGASVYWKSMNV